MIAFLLGIIFLTQGVPPLSTDSGTITGIVKTASGEPASGIRVTAMARPESLVDAASAASFAGLAETDDDGRYRLENIPPGQYYVAAGRVDLPTYFPGTLEMLKGSPVSITSKAVVSNINFTMDDASVRAPGSDLSSVTGSVAGLTMPVQVRMEGDVKQPVFADGHSVLIRFTRVQDQSRSEMVLTDSIQNFSIPSPLPGMEYRVTVENLPKGYILKSMIQDGVDLLNNSLKLTAKNFAQSVVSMTGAVLPGAYVMPFRSNAGVPMTPLEITLAAVSTSGQTEQGVRVTGRATSAGTWYLSISGISGILFADGSFEFRGVPPGRHVILLQDKPDSPSRILAASVVVGTRDLDGVLADDTRVLPSEVQFPTSTPSPGSIPLAWIHGRVTDDASKEPVFGGSVTLAGKIKVTFPIDSQGQFEIPRLLPGSYDLTIDGFQHTSIRQNLIVGDDDVQLNVSARASN
jgi:hypothetical protein